ncbi:S41 family peptidase [Sphingorhabdus sp. SMR4y]|uniref:S41 family peptidase n=1 Tax=Sphingorhabdus sp. SMR4y TaxID=2584094 RepID=UPI000B5CF6BE|nr:S41 family peptidase [Sphingorhabdus sp. SMR4y]ASK88541.1 peptidase family S41 [Sphingorhabdus sp. SMR4y]
MTALVKAIPPILALFMVAPVFAAEQAPAPMTEKVSNFDAAQAWQEFEDHFRLFYAYAQRHDIDVEAQLARSRALALQADGPGEFRKILHQTALTFSDPHFIVGPFDQSDYSVIPTGSDIVSSYSDGRFHVADVRAGSAADKAGIRPGWQIVSADGVDMNSAAIRPYGQVLPEPTDKQKNYGAMLAVSGLRNRPRTLVFKVGGESRTISLPPTYDLGKTISAGPLLESSRNGDIAIIRINNALGNNDLIPAFDRAVADLSDTRAMIIDLRNTPSGGNTEVARSIIGHFVTDTRSYQIHEIPSIEREFTVPRRFIEQVKPREPHYRGPVVVLGGRWTGSMGEGLVIGLDAAAGAYTIASDMADLLGALSNITLEKSGARMDLGTETLFHVNGTPREDYIADIPLESADRDAHGRDPAMRSALEYLHGGNNVP